MMAAVRVEAGFNLHQTTNTAATGVAAVIKHRDGWMFRCRGCCKFINAMFSEKRHCVGCVEICWEMMIDFFFHLEFV